MRALKVGNWAKHPSVHHSVTYLHQPVVHETTSVQLELDSGTREEEGTTCSIQSTDDGPWGPLGQQGDVQTPERPSGTMTPGAYKHLQSPDGDPGSFQTAHLGGPTQTSVINIFTRLHVSQGTTRLNCETCQKMYMPPHPNPSFCFRKSGMNLGIHIQLNSKQGRASGHRPPTSDSRKSKCNFTVSPPCKRFHTCRVNTC